MSDKIKPDTREAWLVLAAKHLGQWLAAEGAEVPPMRLSVGWPGGRSNRNRTIGQCWKRACAADGVNQIFISPVRGEEDTIKVLATLLHEIIHAVDDCESGHRGAFAKMARAQGFTAPLTSSDNLSPELEERLTALAEIVGVFPHPQLTTVIAGSEEPKKQTTRMLKVECPEDGYTVRTTRKWLDELGAPICPCTTQMEVSA
jgi:hypothetical protein